MYFFFFLSNGPNYYNFGTNEPYEIHIKNKAGTPGDDITYRFSFHSVNEDPSTFFNIRLGKQNLKMTYKCEKSTDGGMTFQTIILGGIVPPANIRSRSIQGKTVGLEGINYESPVQNAISTASCGEKVFCGSVDDPFFVDLAGAFDVRSVRPEGNATNATKDGLSRFNFHTIAIKVPVNLLQKDGKGMAQATSTRTSLQGYGLS